MIMNPIQLTYKKLFFLITIYFISILIIGFLSKFIFNNKSDIEITFNLLGSYLLCFILYYLLIMKEQNETYNFKFFIKKKNIILFPIILFLFFGSFIVTNFIVDLIPTNVPILNELYKKMNELLLEQFSNQWIQILIIAFIAPIFEELFFRGVILKGLLNNTNYNSISSIILSALIFGIIHVFPWQVIGATLFGLLLGYIFYKTRSLFYPLLVHILNNLIAIILQNQLNDQSLNYLFHINKYILFIIGIIILILFGFLFFKFTKNNQWKSY